MSNDSFEWIKFISTIVVIGGGIIAAFKAISEMQQKRRQENTEYKWKRAKEAFAIIDELLTDPLASKALMILDWSREHTLPDGAKVTIGASDLPGALRTSDLRFDEKEIYIRDCFDSFFGYTERIEHALQIDYVDFNAISFPLKYYVKILAQKKQSITQYLNTYSYTRSLELLNRFDNWQTAA